MNADTGGNEELRCFCLDQIEAVQWYITKNQKSGKFNTQFEPARLNLKPGLHVFDSRMDLVWSLSWQK